MSELQPECIFCRIARGALPAHFVYQSERVVAFLDLRPIRPGHALIVPREHFAYYDDLPEPVGAEVLRVGQMLAPLLRRRFDCTRVAFLFTGVDIAHAHAHVVPMVEETDITSPRYVVERPLTFRPAPMAERDDLESIATALREALGESTRSGRTS